MTGLRHSPLHVTEFCGEMRGKFKVGLARLKKKSRNLNPGCSAWVKSVLTYNLCMVYEEKTKDCVGSWTFQHKSWHLCLFL